jgi:hypothetical protein
MEIYLLLAATLTLNIVALAVVVNKLRGDLREQNRFADSRIAIAHREAALLRRRRPLSVAANRDDMRKRTNRDAGWPSRKSA